VDTQLEAEATASIWGQGRMQRGQVKAEAVIFDIEAEAISRT